MDSFESQDTGDAVASDDVSDVEESAPPAPKKPEPPKNPYAGTKHRVKVDDREDEVDYDELVANYQLKQASDKRFKQAKQMQRDATEAFEAMKRGDLSLLKQLVPKDVLRKFSEDELLEYIEHESMTPEQKRAWNAEQKAAEYEAKLKEREERDQTEEQRRIQERVDREVEEEFMEAVNELGFKVKNMPALCRRMAEQMQASLLASQQDPEARPMPAKIAAAKARREQGLDFEEYAKTASPQEVIAKLPRHIRDAIRKADVDSVISQMPSGIRRSTQNSTAESEPTTSRAKKKHVSVDEFFSNREKKYQ